MKSKKQQKEENAQSRMKIGIFGLTGCKGCRLVVSNNKNEMENLFHFVETPFSSTNSDVREMDIALVEGQVSSEEDLDLLTKIRERAKYLIALGTCACEGEIQAAIDEYGAARSEEREDIEGKSNYTPIDEPGELENFVEVDYFIRGCPVRKEEVLYNLNKFVAKGVNKNEELKLPFLKSDREMDLESIISLDSDKCILCRRCDTICNDVLGIHAISVSERGPEAMISTPFGRTLDNSGCIYCGQCVSSCPVGALQIKSSIEESLEILNSDSNFTIVIVDPLTITSVLDRLPTNENDMDETLEKIVSALKYMGADKVIDFLPYAAISAAAQAEEVDGEEPTFASWCPSVRSYIEKSKAGYEKYIEEDTSPENILLKDINNTYDEDNIETILITPCVAHKREDQFDAVLMSKELPKLLDSENIWLDIYGKNGSFDNPHNSNLGVSLKNEVRFSYTPLILEIAFRRIYENPEMKLKSNQIDNGISEYIMEDGEDELSGLVIEKLSKLDELPDNKIAEYDSVEIIPCFKGCITGGGQYPTTSKEEVKKRLEKFQNYKKNKTPSSNLISKTIESYENIERRP